MAIIPRSIAGRTIAVLIAGMTLAHALSFFAHQFDLLNQLDISNEQYLAERITSIQRVIEDMPATDRDRTAHALSSSTLEVHWGPITVLKHGASDRHARMLYERIRDRQPDLTPERVRLSYEDDAAAVDLRAHTGDRVLRVAVQLVDATWTNMSIATRDRSTHGSFDFLASTSLMVLAVLVLSAFLVQIVTAPLRALGRSAERMGTDVGGASLQESGPDEVRQATRALNLLQDRIRTLIASRTQMFAAISHDLKTPITRLRLRADLLENGVQREKIVSDLDEMESMIASVLAFLREDSDKEQVQIIDLAALLRTICDDVIDAGRRVDASGIAPAEVRGKSLALKRAFTNLIDNACKYGGEAEVRLTTLDHQIRVAIDDRGPGIPEGEREKVFAPFYRIESSRSRTTGGTGLGLTAARSIVQSHGGDIALSDRPGGGLRVTVSLPAHAAR